MTVHVCATSVYIVTILFKNAELLIMQNYLPYIQHLNKVSYRLKRCHSVKLISIHDNAVAI